LQNTAIGGVVSTDSDWPPDCQRSLAAPTLRQVQFSVSWLLCQ